MSIISQIIGYLLLIITASFVLLAIWKYIKNIKGWERMKKDREKKGKPFYGEMEEELEKEKYGIED